MPRITTLTRPRLHNPDLKKTASLTEVNWVCVSGILVTYEGSDDQLLATGLIAADELPQARRGCNRRTDQFKAYRLANGNVRLQMEADIVAKRTPGFKQFLGGLLFDSRLSLVRGEVRP